MGVHPETQAGHEPLGYLVLPPHGRQACHVLLRSAQSVLVAPHEDVRPAVHQHQGVHAAEMVRQRATGRAQRPDSGARQRVHRGRQTLPLEPPGECASGK